MSVDPVQILAPDGTLVGTTSLSTDEIRHRYAAMVTARAHDQKASALQRQGRLATYASYEGQEAAQIGAVGPLERRDWLVASYRDAAAMQHHGYPWKNLLLTRMGDERGGHPPPDVNVMPPSITVGGHMIHAVGIAWAAKLQGSDAVAMTTFGDGATSEGDFHEAMNFAGVFRTPTIFVCQNNGWAISLPVARQTASATIAQKADAYGMPGVLVDGNDILAVEQVVSEAVSRARAGLGPTLVEALTYRVQGHTTADDHSRYRTDEDVAAWIDKDPIARVRTYLQSIDAWTSQWQGDIEASAGASIDAAVVEAESTAAFTSDEIFEAMFDELPRALDSQRTAAGESAT